MTNLAIKFPSMLWAECAVQSLVAALVALKNKKTIRIYIYPGLDFHPRQLFWNPMKASLAQWKLTAFEASLVPSKPSGHLLLSGEDSSAAGRALWRHLCLQNHPESWGLVTMKKWVCVFCSSSRFYLNLSSSILLRRLAEGTFKASGCFPCEARYKHARTTY